MYLSVSVVLDHSDCVEAGGGEGGGEGTWILDSPATKESNTHLQTGPEHLQGTG